MKAKEVINLLSRSHWHDWSYLDLANHSIAFVFDRQWTLNRWRHLPTIWGDQSWFTQHSTVHTAFGDGGQVTPQKALKGLKLLGEKWKKNSPSNRIRTSDLRISVTFLYSPPLYQLSYRGLLENNVINEDIWMHNRKRNMNMFYCFSTLCINRN